MARLKSWAMLAASTLALAAPAPAAEAAGATPPASGSLYPKSAASASELERALGPAGYILKDLGPDESFRAAVRAAIGSQPVYHQEVSRREEARAHIRAERAALYPRLSASLSGDYVLAREFGTATDNIVESLRPNGQVNAGLSASQLVFDGGAALARIKSAKAHDRAAALTIDARVNDLALAALAAYHDLATHQAVMKAGEAFIARHEALLSNVKERARLGAGAQAEVMQASARLASARARVSQIRESMRLAEVRYQQFFRTEPGLLYRPGFEGPAVRTRIEAARLAAENHPEIGAAAGRTDRASAELRAAKAARLPELRASVSAVKFDLIEGSDDFDVRAGVNVNYDIFNGGARGAQIAQAAAVANQQKFDEARVREEVERDAMIAFERREAAAERLAALAEAVIASAEARRLISERFRAARGDLIDVLQAENDYFEATVAYLAGLADRDMAAYGLMEHTGDLLRSFSPQDGVASKSGGE
jgi:adhesin transport system outer membrane protein